MYRRRPIRFGHFVHVRSAQRTYFLYRPPSIRLSTLSLQNDAYKDTFGNPGSNAQGAIVAAMPAGSLVGALIVTSLADLIGRKKTIITSGWIWVIGSILQCASVVRTLHLHVGRVLIKYALDAQ